MAVVTVGPTSLTVGEIAVVAGGAQLVLADGVLDRLAVTRDTAVSLARQRPVYGRSTGVGANKGVAVDDGGQHALRLLHSHATSAGPLRAARRVRAMLAIRCSQLAAGSSGVAPSVLEALVTMLADDDLPPVREFGSLGTGDLSALATTAVALITRGVTLDENDALALISSNAATLADAALAAADLTTLAQASLSVAALTFAAVDGNGEAFAPLVELATPFPGARAVCLAMRSLAEGVVAARIQDPFGLRALPQVHGVLLDALAALTGVVEALASAGSENPVFGVDPPAVAHHGGFHMAYLATALDTVRSAVAQAAQLSLARLGYLVDPALTGLPAFLGDGTPGASGVMVVEYVVASALAELRLVASPAAVQSVSISRGAEDDASFASLGARLAFESTGPYQVVVAGELLSAVRALRLRGVPTPAPVAELLALCSALPAGAADRDLTDDLAVAGGLLTSLVQVASSSGRSSSA
ncbi:aromatic amino acid ammonia-lyase [Acidothermaceae bacterium B102]|nr:aromatic amino acid ammonia-lyase [Acidothermaceae bacterium B102]